MGIVFGCATKITVNGTLCTVTLKTNVLKFTAWAIGSAVKFISKAPRKRQCLRWSCRTLRWRHITCFTRKILRAQPQFPMSSPPRDLRRMRLAQKSKVFVTTRAIVVARGQILDNLTILHEREGLMGASLCIDGNKYVKSAKSITNITYLFGLGGRFQNKRGRLARRRRPRLKFVTCGWVLIAQQNTECDKLFLPYFFLNFVWYPRIQRQTSGMKWLSRQLLCNIKWTWLT